MWGDGIFSVKLYTCKVCNGYGELPKYFLPNVERSVQSVWPNQPENVVDLFACYYYTSMQTLNEFLAITVAEC